MANELRRRLRTFRRDAMDIAGSAIVQLGNRISPRAPVLERAFDEIGPAEQSSALSLIDGESNILAGQAGGIYESHLFANSCVAYTAQAFAQLPLRFYRQTVVAGEASRVPADDDPVARMFDNWNPFQSSFEAQEWMCSWLELSGTAYAAKVERDENTPDGIPFELYPLFPEGLTILRSENIGIVAYRYRLRGREQIFAPSDVWTIRRFSTSDRFSGMGRLHAGRKEILTDLRARQWNDELLKRGVHVSGTLETDTEDLTPSTAKQIQKSFMNQYGGASRAARVAVLWGGLKFKPQTLAHKDIFWAEQLRMTKEDISAAFGVPEELMGAKSANFASLREKRRIFWEDTVKGIARRFESALNSTFLPSLSPGLIAEFDLSDVEALQEDRGEQVKSGEIAIRSGQYTINEWRQRVLGLDAIDGGDVLMIGRGLVPLEAAIVDNAGTGDDQRSTGSRRSPALARALQQFDAAGSSKSIESEEWLRAVDALRTDTETRIQNVVRAYYSEVERAITETAAASVDDLIVRAETELLLVERRQVVTAKAESTLRRAAEKAGGQVFVAAGAEGVFNLPNTQADLVLRRQAKRIKNIGIKRWRELREVLREELANGSSERQMRDSVRTFFRDRRANALTIARTETSMAINSAHHSATVEAIKLGARIRLEWNTVQDEATRSAHATAHGLTIDPTLEMFVVNGESLRFPGDSENGSAENTINCRCAARPIVDLTARPKAQDSEVTHA